MLPDDILIEVSYFLNLSDMKNLRLCCQSMYYVFDKRLMQCLLDTVIGQGLEAKQIVYSKLTNLSKINFYVFLRLLDIINNSTESFIIDIINTALDTNSFTVTNSYMYNVRKWTIILYCSSIDIQEIENIMTSYKVANNRCDIIIYEQNNEYAQENNKKIKVLKDMYSNELCQLDTSKQSKEITFTKISYNFKFM